LIPTGIFFANVLLTMFAPERANGVHRFLPRARSRYFTDAGEAPAATMAPGSGPQRDQTHRAGAA
jgi:hypothetical protein